MDERRRELFEACRTDLVNIITELEKNQCNEWHDRLCDAGLINYGETPEEGIKSILTLQHHLRHKDGLMEWIEHWNIELFSLMPEVSQDQLREIIK